MAQKSQPSHVTRHIESTTSFCHSNDAHTCTFYMGYAINIHPHPHPPYALCLVLVLFHPSITLFSFFFYSISSFGSFLFDFDVFLVHNVSPSVSNPPDCFFLFSIVVQHALWLVPLLYFIYISPSICISSDR